MVFAAKDPRSGVASLAWSSDFAGGFDALCGKSGG